MPAALLVALGAIALGALGCHRPKVAPARIEDTRKQMNEQFIRVANDYGSGSSKIVDRGYLGLQDPVPDETGRYGLPQKILFELLAETIAKSPLSNVPQEVVQRVAPGDFLGRVWSIYGPPGKGEPSESFDYTFIDRKTGIIFTAYSAGSGPSYGGGFRYDGPFPPPPTPAGHLQPRVRDAQFLEVVKRFEGFLEKAPLADCMLVQEGDFGLFRIGARAGKPFQEDLSFAESIDLYADLARRYDPESSEEQIRTLWVKADAAERRQRPAAVAFARRAWQRDLESLEKRTEDRDVWRYAWEALDQQAPLLGADTPENRRRLERVREPPPVAKTSPDGEGSEAAKRK
jgi:hypothetical protein